MNSKIIVGLASLLSVVAAGISAFGAYTIKKFSDKFDTSVTELSEKQVKDIQDVYVHQAVTKAAEKKVDSLLTATKEDILAEQKARMKAEVKNAVDDANKDIRAKISDQLSEEASKIDMTALKHDVKLKAEQKVMDKFDGNLEDLLDRFNGNLSNMQKIYGSIADTLKGSQHSGTTFTIN